MGLSRYEAIENAILDYYYKTFPVDPDHGGFVRDILAEKRIAALHGLKKDQFEEFEEIFIRDFD